MPAPAVYALAAIGTVAAVLAFKEFVYEPHLAPKVDQWIEEIRAKRRARQRQRQFERPVEVQFPFDKKSRSDDGSSDGDDKAGGSAFELEKLVSPVAQEVREWRNEVDRSQSSTLRQRRPGHPLDQSDTFVPFSPMQPAQVLFDSSPTLHSMPTPNAAQSPSLHSATSYDTLRSPPPVPSTPLQYVAPSLQYSSPPVSPPAVAAMSPPSHAAVGPPPPAMDTSVYSPTSVPSLSLSHPVDLLEHEQGLELLSPPSSRPDTPFSSISVTNDSEYRSAFDEDTLPSGFLTPVDAYQSLAPSSVSSIEDLGARDADFQDAVRASPELVAEDSDLEDLVSNPSVMSDFDDLRSNDGSEISGSSWASANLRSP
ncbi:hypothetical protein CYLTODRAFT_489789 [Cylindrobasidium torrendii FP15055 ss-10]|uniref:Uncharacterized protein n=1 Tax=Cylindrobasidium torrendii FP15055 ss-10 TaxID=1314674 RepID=A0A0D7BD42_9AGAR|nr:hypothetical protein CYLTODRAFT_489789 [Cylindrobasidium torrendii FP15055 ss-10]